MKSKRSGGAPRTRNARRVKALKLVLEPLESRRLLAGINVSIYIDGNGSRGFEPSGDAPAADRLVYVDLDRNGKYNPGEPIQVTGSDGTAFFDNLPDGEYAVGLITNPKSQSQAEPTSVARSTVRIAESSPARLVSNADLTDVWSIDSSGQIEPVVGGPSLDSPIDLGGFVTASTTNGNVAWLVHESPMGQRLTTLDLATGESTSQPISNLLAGESIIELAASQSKIIGLIAGLDGNSVASLAIAGESAVLSSRTLVPATHIVGSTATDSIIGISSAGGETRLQTIDVASSEATFLTRSSFLPNTTSEVTLSVDGSLLLLATEVGVKAMSVAPGGLELVAWLSEASGPLAANSVDRRIVTGNSTDATELIVWDTRNWLPIGRSQIASGNAAAVLSSRRGDIAIVRSESAIERMNLAVAALQNVSLVGENGNASVRLGVQPHGANTAPDVSKFISELVAVEDTPQQIDLTENGITDADGDTLWYSLSTPATHGDFRVDSAGIWKYSPNLNFNGNDSAVVRVHDGQSSTEVRVQWKVTPVNDPPISIAVETRPVDENTAIGTEIGMVSIVDADRDASYRITTSDSRFTVEDGRIYLSSGEFDFESEKTLLVQIEAIDTTDDSIRISTLANLVIVDTSEAPTALRLSSTNVAENSAGSVVGLVEVDDPDALNDFEFSVSDPRFYIDSNQQLRLHDSESLNFEAESTIDLRVTVRDKSADYEKAADFALSVLDLDDAPTAVLLSKLEVEERVDGGLVGQVTVVDEDGGLYGFDVSDSRFEVVGTTLKLRDDVQLDAAAASQINLTVTARSRSGHTLANNFPLNVVPPKSPWQNPKNPHDVNGDGDMTPLDVLILVNLLNKYGSHPLQPSPGSGGEGPETMPDVNGDGSLTPVDVLLIINELNDRRGEGESHPSTPPTQLVDSSLTGESEAERRKRINSEIDVELELLVDQINQPAS
jgi:hypothetical protein